MEQLVTFYRSCFSLLFSLTSLFPFERLNAQPNCLVYQQDAFCYEACLEAEIAVSYSQGSKKSQEHFNNSINLCSTFDYSYFEKSVPFAKRGLIEEWYHLINKAVELEPNKHLGWRAWYHYFFLRNYSATLEDIEKLELLRADDIGETGDGRYHLKIIKGLCYKGLGNLDEAISIIEAQVSDKQFFVGAYDYLHLGSLYLDKRKYLKSIGLFDKQLEYNPVAEASYYKGLAFVELGDLNKATQSFNRAIKYYDDGYKVHDPYTELDDQIFKREIKKKKIR